MARKSISSANNSDRELIQTVKQSPEFGLYEMYFQEERGISVENPEINRVKTPEEDTHFIVSFELDDEADDTKGSLNFTLSDGIIVRTGASIDYYENDEIVNIETFEIEGGEVISEQVSV